MGGREGGRPSGEIRSKRRESRHLLVYTYLFLKRDYKMFASGDTFFSLQMNIHIFHIPPSAAQGFEIKMIRFPVKYSRGGE